MTQFRRKTGLLRLFCMSVACAGFATVSRAAAAPRVVPLWPDQSEPSQVLGEAGPGEVVKDRGKDGAHDRSVTKVTEPTLTVFLAEKPDPARPAIVVCPGGGYTALAIDKEGYAIAQRLNQAGVAAIVLKYRLPAGRPPVAEGSTPLPIQDVQRAIRFTRAHATEWNIDPSRVGVMGFSAGGHVASTAATQFDAGDDSASYDPIARQSSRPDFAVLMYPVVSMRDAPAHKGSRHNLLGENPPEKQIDRFSGELHVTDKTPPLFIVHAKDDKSVIVENSTKLAEAAKLANVPHELVLFEEGGHGFGLGPPGSECSAWPDRLLAWMRVQKLLMNP